MVNLTKPEKIFLGVILFAALLSVSIIYLARLNFPPIRSDGIGYYSYLPTVVIHQDINFESLIIERFKDELEVPDNWTGIRLDETGEKYINKYPVGVAILTVPFFLVAHILSLITGLDQNGGFGVFYQLAVGFSGIFFMLAGILVLKRLLDKFFDSKTTYTTLLLLIFGTNFFHYGTYDSTFSHVHSLFLITSFVYLTILWHKSVNWARTILVGVVSGLIVIVRPANVVVLLFFLLYGYGTKNYLSEKLKLYWRNRKHLIVIALLGGIVLLPQLLYLNYATGSVIGFSYEPQEGFDFTTPQLYNVLFSVRKGLFFWSPVLLFFIPGLVLWYKDSRLRKLLLPSLVVLAISTWIIASWWHWPYGGSFGHRAFIDYFVFFALGLGTFVDWVFRRQRSIKFVFLALFTLATMITIKSMIQYWLGVIEVDGTSWKYFIDNFWVFENMTIL